MKSNKIYFVEVATYIILAYKINFSHLTLGFRVEGHIIYIYTHKGKYS